MAHSIKYPQFVSFVASPAGRWTRVAIGLAMISAGLILKNKKGASLAALGAIPLAAGAFDFCVAGPWLAGLFWGQDIRKALHQQQGFGQLGGQSVSWTMA